MRRVTALVLLLGGGCLLGPQPLPPANEGVWPQQRDRMTRSGKLYDGLSTNAFARVVYLPREVREARVARIAAWKAFSVEETERMLVAERDDAARFEEFLLTLFTPTPADNDLDAQASVWRVALVIPGSADVLPESIRQVRPDAMLRMLHPEVEEFYITYRVRFARQHALEGRSFVLRLAGAKGRLDFQY